MRSAADRAAAGSLPAPPCGRVSAAVSSMAAISASQSSAANSGGRNTCISPSRGSTHSAVRTRSGSPRPITGSVLRHRTEAFEAGGHAARRGGAARNAWRGGSGGARRERVRLDLVLDRFGIGPGQAVQRQAQADRRIAGDQEHRAAAEEPLAALPAARAVARSPGAAAARCRPARPGPGRTPAPAARVPSGRAAWRPRRRRWPAGGARATGSSGCPRRPGCTSAGSICSRSASAAAKRAASSALRGVGVVARRPAAPDRATPARRPARQCAVQRPARQLLAGILLAHARIAAPRRAPSAPSAGGAACSA